MTGALRMAVGTLTAIPVRPPDTIDRRVAGRAMVLAPVAAVPLAALAAGVVAAGEWVGLFPLVTALLAVTSVVLSNRALHLDGLSDTADALAASYDRDRALDVMHRGDAGPAGAAALVLVLLGQVAGVAGAIVAGHGVYAAVVAVLAGRLVVPVCCTRGIPAARTSGLGGVVSGSVPRWQAAAAMAVGMLLASAGALVAGVDVWRGAVAVVAAGLAAAAVLRRCVRRFGGITGDVLGAAIEVATVAALVTLAA